MYVRRWTLHTVPRLVPLRTLYRNAVRPLLLLLTLGSLAPSINRCSWRNISLVVNQRRRNNNNAWFSS